MTRGPENEVFLTPGEVADSLGIDRRTLDAWEKAGKLRPIRGAGNRRRFRRSELLLLMAKDEPRAAGRQPTAEPAHEAAAAPAPVRVREPSQRERHAAARRRALEVLHACDVRNSDPTDDLGEADDAETRLLVEGVAHHRVQIDQVIARAAEHWSLERMPVVDRNAIRVGAFELLHRPEVPTGAIISEAVSLAKLLSTEDSARFVNGVLGRIARDHR